MRHVFDFSCTEDIRDSYVSNQKTRLMRVHAMFAFSISHNLMLLLKIQFYSEIDEKLLVCLVLMDSLSPI